MIYIGRVTDKPTDKLIFDVSDWYHEGYRDGPPPPQELRNVYSAGDRLEFVVAAVAVGFRPLLRAMLLDSAGNKRAAMIIEPSEGTEEDFEYGGVWMRTIPDGEANADDLSPLRDDQGHHGWRGQLLYPLVNDLAERFVRELYLDLRAAASRIKPLRPRRWEGKRLIVGPANPFGPEHSLEALLGGVAGLGAFHRAGQAVYEVEVGAKAVRLRDYLPGLDAKPGLDAGLYVGFDPGQERVIFDVTTWYHQAAKPIEQFNEREEYGRRDRLEFVLNPEPGGYFVIERANLLDEYGNWRLVLFTAPDGEAHAYDRRIEVGDDWLESVLYNTVNKVARRFADDEKLVALRDRAGEMARLAPRSWEEDGRLKDGPDNPFGPAHRVEVLLGASHRTPGAGELAEAVALLDRFFGEQPGRAQDIVRAQRRMGAWATVPLAVQDLYQVSLAALKDLARQGQHPSVEIEVMRVIRFVGVRRAPSEAVVGAQVCQDRDKLIVLVPPGDLRTTESIALYVLLQNAAGEKK